MRGSHFKVYMGTVTHFANPSNNFSTSFSRFQESASNSFAGVGGW